MLILSAPHNYKVIKEYLKKPLVMALFISILLHLAPFIVFLIEYPLSEESQQVSIQVTLLPDTSMQQKAVLEPKVEQKKEAPAEPKKVDRNKEISKKRNKEIMTSEEGKEIPIDPVFGAPESADNNAVVNESLSKEAVDTDIRAKTEESNPIKDEDAESMQQPIVVSDSGAPVYPKVALKRKLESCVLSAVYVSSTGKVEKVVILHADVKNFFDDSVIDAQSGTVYLPARENNKAVDSRVLAVASFVLDPRNNKQCAYKYADVARKINLLPYDTNVNIIVNELTNIK